MGALGQLGAGLNLSSMSMQKQEKVERINILAIKTGRVKVV